MRENRQEWFKCRSQEVPLWHRQNLSVDEMAVYTGIGRETIRSLTEQKEAINFTLRVGKRTMIKRKRFEAYLEKLYSI